MKWMKILRAISSVNSAGGGPINGLINSSRILQDRGHSVTVLSLDPIDAPWVKEFDFPIVTFAGKFASYLYVSKCAFWLKENVQQYDAVIIHGLWQYHSIATAIACAECNVPYFVFTHGMLDPWFNVGQRMKAFKKNIYWKVRENQVVNNATAVLFTSEEEKILARDVFLPYFPTERVVLYGSAAPQCTEVDAVDTFYDVYPKLKNVRFYLYLSRIHEKKGLDLLLRVIADSSVLDDDSILVIAGSGSPYYISYIKGLIVSLGI
jgi:glycosyltransferase involved in cell wall biosynthesis